MPLCGRASEWTEAGEVGAAAHLTPQSTYTLALRGGEHWCMHVHVHGALPGWTRVVLALQFAPTSPKKMEEKNATAAIMRPDCWPARFTFACFTVSRFHQRFSVSANLPAFDVVYFSSFLPLPHSHSLRPPPRYS